MLLQNKLSITEIDARIFEETYMKYNVFIKNVICVELLFCV